MALPFVLGKDKSVNTKVDIDTHVVTPGAEYKSVEVMLAGQPDEAASLELAGTVSTLCGSANVRSATPVPAPSLRIGEGWGGVRAIINWQN